eukprot:CAMPEP_0113310298 /NCGR_PEP_ID=MMETSP0010_2-20120614/7999_1 /TAXON_ID=216773 ORGANISM="Corethron hystrix, Strain 308" /NCGR_SAMPLE_ID=MMETSP0010_2 /ASSEMBLY_ACC=CAM_ASM_000155 /LENGTH=398 /DNA_ID=CAMNT_0000165725 /DNA_START=371 /DNA_END=1567 /DNA_ORIENTATION=- /assembly_acc=CAM_ASM_000155
MDGKETKRCKPSIRERTTKDGTVTSGKRLEISSTKSTNENLIPNLENLVSSTVQEVRQRTSQLSHADLRRIVHDALYQRTVKFWAGIVVVVGCAYTLVAFVYPQEARATIASELSDVASRSLADERMQDQAISTIQALVSDEETVQRTVEFVQKVVQNEPTRDALVDLLVRALRDPAVMQQALGLVHWILQNPDARKNLVGALNAAITSESFLSAAGVFGALWVHRPEVQDAVAEVLRDASLRVLEDDAIRGDAAQFLRELLQEPMLQEKTGEHIWGAVRGLVLPNSWRKPRRMLTEPILPTAQELGITSTPTIEELSIVRKSGDHSISSKERNKVSTGDELGEDKACNVRQNQENQDKKKSDKNNEVQTDALTNGLPDSINHENSQHESKDNLILTQ